MLIYFAILLTGLIGFTGLVVDVGHIETRSLQLQVAADSAVLSAVAEFQRTNNNFSQATNAANAELASYASLNNIPTPTGTLTSPASFGPNATVGSAFKFVVTAPVSTTLLGLIKGGHSTLTASATATALMPPCIFLMGNPSIPSRGNNNLSLNSQGFNLSCPMYSTTGYYVDGFSHINGFQAISSGPAGQSYGGGWESPPILSNAPLLADPLAYIATPTFNACTPGLSNQNYQTPQTIHPGTYCGSLRVTGTTITMSPGLYIITGGVDFNNATIIGNGVTMYLTRGGGSSFGQFKLEQNSYLNVSAPLDSSNNGRPAVLLMTDPAWCCGNEDVRFDTSSMKGDGILYIRGTGVYNWQTAMSGYNYFGFDVANFSFQNANIQFSENYSQLPGGDPFRTVVSLVQ